MSQWFEFALFAITEFVSMIFDIDLPGLGFSIGDFLVAAAVISVVVSALVIKSGHLGGGRIDFTVRGDRHE